MALSFYRRLKRFSVISFDLDDTLYDNVPIMQAAEHNVQRFIEQHYPQTRHWQLEHWRQRRNQLMTRNVELASNMTLLRLTTLREGFAEAGVKDPERAAERVMEQFHRHRSDFEVAAETHQLLQQLSQRYRLAAISNGNVDCQRIGLSQWFDIIVQPTQGLRGKPHRDMFDAVLAHYSIAAEELLHIGDHPTSDILGAHRAGCQTGWFGGGLGTFDQLRVLPTFRFNQLQQLHELLDTGCVYSG
ncbi:phosphoesterase [Idiomarina sp. OT37-5b]|jgi:putative hydrolase of the HAD superfamily|uniref:Phosphoesterase n=2 Tax=Idiomarinaceae TaxID=267893 RepID=A0AA94ED94_9GAMM|nr:phosphoesterase [Idiomarina sp. OT37-5b]RUO40411.1 phosphoesterase [Idiomarina aquatica]